MKIFCDTNVLIAGVVENHPHHNAARPIIERVKTGADAGLVSLHSLAESYAVLTRLPGGNHVAPGIAWQLIHENVIKNFSLIALTATDYSKALEDASCDGVEGGMIYDALLLAAAVKGAAERIYTFNVTHFQNIANENLRRRILSP